MSENQYFAAKDADQTADILLSRANAWYNQLYSNGYLTKVRDMWMAYHGCYYTGPGNSHKVSFGGEQGELVNLAVNHIRNLAQHMLVMITAQRPTMTARATNSDYKSVVQVKLAEGLLDYYMREKRLEKYLRTATEYAIVFGSGYIKMAWNATSGEVYEISEETGVPIYEGDVEFRNLSPFDVVFDMSKETAYEQDWVMTRTFKNKFDLAAKFPEQEEKIKGLQTKSDLFRYRMDLMGYDDTDDVPVYEFYHKRTESMPDGRYLLFLDSNIVLMDTPMPYRSLPVYRIAPQEILGTPFGYTPMFDLLPIQDSINSLYSTILTNQHAFGIQNVYVPRGADVSLKALEGGLNIIEGNGQAGKPEALNLTQTPKEIFDFVQMLERLMETISGINSVARGNPEASLKSGAALALVQSQALQFMSGLQQQYVQLVEDMGTGLIDMLKDFAAVPRIAMIVGKSNSSYIQREFTGEELNQVNRIIVDMGNALSKTTAGKMQLAEQMMQYGVISNAEDILSVMETGRLDVMTDETYRELMLIRQENEALAEGEEVRVLGIDKHIQHINHHKSILSDPRLRMDDQLTERVLNHIQEHINELRNFDPGLLQLIGEQPLGPIGGTPPAPQGPNVPPQQAQMSPEQNPMGPPPGPGEVPNMPQMPQVDPNMLPNPELQAQNMGNIEQ